MERRRFSWCIRPLAAALLTFALALAPALAGEGSEKSHLFSLGSPIGTWFCSVTGADFTFELLATLHLDGTVTSTDTNDFVGLNPSLGLPVNSPIHGVYRFSLGAPPGSRRIEIDLFGFEYGGAGEPNAGLLVDAFRNRCSATVRFNSMKGSCDVDVFLPVDPEGDGLPNAPNLAMAEPDFSFPEAFTFECSRLQVLRE